MKRISYLFAAVLFMLAFMFAPMMAMAQTIWPVANDVVISMYNGMGNTNRYIEADKTGRLQFLMYGQDPSPGAPVGQLRPQRRVFGPSIVCGNTFDATCDVVASAVSIYSSQIADSSATGRSLLTASDSTAARMAIGAGTSTFDGTYAGLTGVPTAFAPATHTHPAAQISDATGAGRSILTAADASAMRALLNVQSTTEAATSYYPLSSNPAAYISRSGISVTGNGSYNTTTGVITIGTSRIASTVTKAIGSCFQLSATRDASVTYNVEITASATVIGGARGTLYLETFTDSACTTGTEEVMRSTSGNTNALIVALGNVLTQTLNVNGWVMAGKWAKLRTTNDTGTPTFAPRPGQEVLQ